MLLVVFEYRVIRYFTTDFLLKLLDICDMLLFYATFPHYKLK